MKKFIISFNYKGFVFSAKVLVKKIAGIIIYSAILVKCEMEFLLRKSSLIFLKTAKDYELILIRKDSSYETLEWKKNAEYIDKSDIMKPYSFSLS